MEETTVNGDRKMGVSLIGILVVAGVLVAVIVGIVIIVMATGRSDRERE